MYRRALLPLLLVAGAGVPVACVAQRYEPPPPPLTVDPCTVKPNPNIPAAPDSKAKAPVCPPPAPANAAPSAPSTADQFPFPGDAPAANQAKPSSAADQFPYPGEAPAAKPATPAKSNSTSDQFPYPGETPQSPDAVPEGDTPRYVPDSAAPGSGGGGSSSSSSSSSDDSSSSSSSSSSGDTAPPGGDDAGSTRKGRRALPKVSAKSLSPDERVTEDLNVAKFYAGRGNFEAAYMRSKDATSLMPDDAESHFSLAVAAQKLQKKDEAVAEYKLYLKLDPGGDRTTAAEKALSELH